MGTSQSLLLKTTPQWSAAKRAMTSVVQNPNNVQKRILLMKAFRQAIGGGLYRGGSSQVEEGLFGHAGAKALSNVIQFISNVKDFGVGQAIDALNLAQVNVPQNPRELIKALCGLTAKNTSALFDEEAAVEAQNKLLSQIWEECNTLGDVEDLLKQAEEDAIDAWIIDFEVEYIVEYLGELFQSHIFDKATDPEIVCSQIKQWLRSELNIRLADEMHHLNIFSLEGKNYIDTLTANILDIWQ